MIPTGYLGQQILAGNWLEVNFCYCLHFFVYVVYESYCWQKEKNIDLAGKYIANGFYCYTDCEFSCTLVNLVVMPGARSYAEFFEVFWLVFSSNKKWLRKALGYFCKNLS